MGAVTMELLPHQVTAVERYILNSSAYPNFLLGDSMGVGKTLSAIGIDEQLRKERKGDGTPFRTLIICQKGGLAVWRKHLEARGVDGSAILTIDPRDRDAFDVELASGANNFQYYIVHWTALILLEHLIPNTLTKVKGIYWDNLIADEVHMVKNRKAKRTLAFKKIKTRVKIGASGTPADDKPHDMWSVLNWMYPRAFSGYWKFYDRYLKWETGYQGYRVVTGTQNIPELHAKIRPFYIRRLLTDVISDMPDKARTEILVQMTPRMMRDYKAMEKYQVAHLGESQESFSVIHKIVMYMRLLQMTAGTCEVDWDKYNKFWAKWTETYYASPEDMPKNWVTDPTLRITEPSPKIDALMELIEDNPGEQIVVFSNFKGMCKILEERCTKSGLSSSVFTGDVSSQLKRDAAVAAFQAGESQVFIGTPGAAGTSITLTASHTLCFLDRHWNPSINEQAEDRIWRIGQKNACQIFDFIAEDTIDEPRIKQIWEKARSVREVVNVK